MHEKFGREHLHVVWARTDIDEMVLRSDSQNYLAHERASQRLEMEFGHEPVPGKHAKRDREQQPEFPRAEANQAEWQQGERTGIDPATRKDQITALEQASDNAQAFKVALEEQGYILAKGDRRDFVIVDQTGSIHSLGRQIRDVKAAELREFMKGIDRETLPTAAQAKDLQQQRQEQLRQQEPAQQQPQQPESSPAEPPPEPPAGSSSEPPPQQPQQQEPKEEEPHQQQEDKPATTPSELASDPAQARAEALRKALAERQVEEGRRLVESQRAEMDQLRQALDRETREKLDRFDAIHRAETEALRRERKEASAGFAGFMNSVQNLFSPARAAEREAERQREQDQLAARLKKERDDYAATGAALSPPLPGIRASRFLAKPPTSPAIDAGAPSQSRFLQPRRSRFIEPLAKVRTPISRFLTGAAALLPPLPKFFSSRFFKTPPTPPRQLRRDWPRKPDGPKF
jgi:hypothetical protein